MEQYICVNNQKRDVEKRRRGKREKEKWKKGKQMGREESLKAVPLMG